MNASLATLRLLLAKDLRRAIRNPVPYLIHLCLPLVITGLLGMVFGSGRQREGGGLGRIKVAIVDEDDSMATRLLRGALGQEQAARHLEAEFLARDEALRRVTNNLVAAALIVPKGFLRDYLTGDHQVRITLVKNPAQMFHPAIVEEAVGAVTTALNAIARNLRPDLEEWRVLLADGRRPGFREIGDLVTRTGERFDAVRRRLDPIPVVYFRATNEVAAAGGTGASRASVRARGGDFNLFAYLLPGLTAMFLIFLADVAMRDLYREVRFRTFDRFRTLPAGVSVFLGSKVVFTFVILAVASVILLGGGSWMFGFQWRHPVAVVGLTIGLSWFAGGLMAALNAWLGGEKKADVINNMVGMALGMAGGCAFPAESLPAFLRDHVTPWLPPNWFVEAMRASQFEGYAAGSWVPLALKMTLLGVALTVLGAWRMRRLLERGGQA